MSVISKNQSCHFLSISKECWTQVLAKREQSQSLHLRMCLYHKHTFTRCVFWNTSQVLWHWVHLVLSNREESSIRHEGLKVIIRRRVYYPWTQKAEILTSVSMALFSDWFLHILLFTSLGVVWQCFCCHGILNNCAGLLEFVGSET